VILPNKHLTLENSLLGMGAEILKHIREPRTVTSLWGEVRSLPQVKTFERFTLGLDFLYAIGAVDFDNGLLRRLER
jgi:hypothetical protein